MTPVMESIGQIPGSREEFVWTAKEKRRVTTRGSVGSGAAGKKLFLFVLFFFNSRSVFLKETRTEIKKGARAAIVFHGEMDDVDEGGVGVCDREVRRRHRRCVVGLW